MEDRTPCIFLQCCVASKGYITLTAEAFRTSYAALLPTLVLLAEPISRPALVHEYRITPFSLGVAVSNGVTANEAMNFLTQHCYELAACTPRETHQSPLYEEVFGFLTACMSRYNLARTVVESNRTLVQCKERAVAEALLRDSVIHSTAQEPVVLTEETSVWDGEQRQFPTFLLRSRAMANAVSARCVRLGLPIQQQYHYLKDDTLRSINMHLKTQTRPRHYQCEAMEAAASGGVLKSGCLLLPCGAGKTLLGIMLMCEVKKPVLVVCAGSVSVEQWKNQILEYASLDAPSQLWEPETEVNATGTMNTNNNNHATGTFPPGVTSGRGRRAAAAATASHHQQPRTGAARIACLTGKQKDDITDETDIVLTTYSMLITAHRLHARRQAKAQVVVDNTGLTKAELSSIRTQNRNNNIKEKLFAPFGLLLLDEVHVIPAESFSESLSFIDAKGAVGLTATYVREDSKIMNLFHLVGPKLYDVSMESLAAQGFLAKVNCVEVHTPMTKEFGMEYMDRCACIPAASSSGGGGGGGGGDRADRVPALVLLAASNPNKMLCVLELVRRHLEGESKILVFCDHIMLLYEYGKLLQAPVISGKTQLKERLMIFSDFQTTKHLNVICVSRVGDVSVNLPNANVVIQVSSHGGSRRQEAQRLGRILRPKERAYNGKIVEAWFYSIISNDTLEMAYAAHRTTFLVDQGYTCRLMDFDPYTTTDAAGATTAKMEGTKAEPVVGDVVTIKQENLHQNLRVDSISAHHKFAKMDMLSKEYQVHLLSKVVSSWEIAFQRASRKRKRQDEEAEDDNEDKTSSDEDVVEVRPERSYATIKKERNAATSGELQKSAGSSAQSHFAASVKDLVGVDDGFVYHEL